jgi:hypothetical protein
VVPTTSNAPYAITPDLAKIAAVWPSLPAAIKAGILAMIEVAESAPKNDAGSR